MLVTSGNVTPGYTRVLLYMLVFSDLWFGLLSIYGLLFVLFGCTCYSNNWCVTIYSNLSIANDG